MPNTALKLENVNGSFCKSEESIILTRLLNEGNTKTKKKIGKTISEFSAKLKHLKDSNISTHEKRNLMNIIRNITIDKVDSLDIDKDICTFTKNVLSIIYKNNIV